MALSYNHQCKKLMIYSLVLYVLISSLLFLSNAASEEVSVPKGRKLSPLQSKRVTIFNRVKNEEVLNIHCRSTEDDLGLQHIEYPMFWSFKFKVNWKGTTKFRCHITWRGGGDHWFTIFKDSRDKCSNCNWEVKGDPGKPMLRVDYIRGFDYFDWDK